MWLPGSNSCCLVVFGKRIPPHKKYDFVYDVIQQHADRPPPLWFFSECFSEMIHTGDNDNYVAELRKYNLPSTRNPKSIPAYRYQMNLSEKLVRITVEFIVPKYTTQKKFVRSCQ